MKIKEIPKEIRPREKAIRYGIENVSDEELLAIIIGSGVRGHSALEIARNLLDTFITMSSLSNTNLSSLEEHSGLSSTLALRLLATFEFHNRLNSPMYQYEHAVQNAEDIYSRYRYLENYSQETLILLMLNQRRKIIKEKMLYKGTNDNVTLNIQEIIKELIMARCQNFVLIHNHPDGSPFPSDDDVYVTKSLDENSKNMQIKMLDHVIIYRGGYYSFNEVEIDKKVF